MKTVKIPATHPRAESLRIRDFLKRGFEEGIVVEQGLIAHGRGEAFDYLLGEKTIPEACEAIKVTASALLISEKPVISVNGNVAILTPREVVKLAEVVGAKIEINLFHRSLDREIAIMNRLKAFGAEEVLGVDKQRSVVLDEPHSLRRWVDSNGILIADTILIPLEDGDRTMALRRMGKTILVIDLNPLSRTAQTGSVTIVDNIVRAMPLLVKEAERLKEEDEDKLREIVEGFNNRVNLGKCISYMASRLLQISDKSDEAQ